MKVMIDLCVVPLGVGVSVSNYVAACQKILDAAGLKHQLHAYGTNVEGDWDAVMGAVKIENSTVRGNVSTRVKGAGALNLAAGSGAEANSGAVIIKNGSNVSGNVAVVSGSGITVNDIDSPVSFGQNVNISVGSGKSNKNSVIMK